MWTSLQNLQKAAYKSYMVIDGVDRHAVVNNKGPITADKELKPWSVDFLIDDQIRVRMVSNIYFKSAVPLSTIFSCVLIVCSRPVEGTLKASPTIWPTLGNTTSKMVFVSVG